ncbi:MAG: TRAP transporter small permease [Paracoccaceae bacterium]|nr:TRAP transporter small permease [Paracoccaceae bacterium]
MKTTHTNTGDAPGTGRRIPWMLKAWQVLVDGLAAMGTVMIGLLMLVICSDVVVRNLFGSSLPLVSELGALMLVMIVYLQLATTVRHDRLARTDIFFTDIKRRFPRAGHLLAAFFDAVGAAVIGGIAWSTVGILEKDRSSGEFIGITGVATMPTWPFRALILVGVTIAAVQFTIQFAASLRVAFGRDKGAGA